MIDLKSVFNFDIHPSHCHEHCFATTWTIPLDLPYFDGHFPGNPILPAVGIIDANNELARHTLKKDVLRLQKIVSAKFLQPVLPGMKVLIHWQLKPDNICYFEWKNADQLAGDATAKTLTQMGLIFELVTASVANL